MPKTPEEHMKAYGAGEARWLQVLGLPDTVKVVGHALCQHDSEEQWEGVGCVEHTQIAEVAVGADRKALTDQGYAIIKVGDVPPWMKLDNSYVIDGPDAYRLVQPWQPGETKRQDANGRWYDRDGMTVLPDGWHEGRN